MSKRSLDETKQKKLLSHIKRFSSARKKYVAYEKFLSTALKELVSPVTKQYVVGARAKTVPSFTGKILKKMEKYKDPLTDMTDLCGARVILQTQAQVMAVCERIKQSFTIDWANSLDASSRLKTSEFGYRSIHFIVSVNEGVECMPGTNVKIPSKLYGLKAEIQVRTFLEHSWADFCHDIIYKSEFNVPEIWKREGATLAAMLEQVDHQFTSILDGLGQYATSYGVYMPPEDIKKKIKQLQVVLQQDPKDLNLVAQIARMMVSLEMYTEAIALLSPYEEDKNADIFNYLGLSLIRQNTKDARAHKKGVKYLEAAMELKNVEAIYNYAFCLKQDLKNSELLQLYKATYEISPSNPTYLAQYLSLVIVTQKCFESVDLLRPHILKAIELSRDHADVALNVPQVFIDMGLLHLLLGQPYQSLEAFSCAISRCESPLAKLMLRDCFTTLKTLKVVKNDIEGYDAVYRLLLLGIYRFHPDAVLRKEINKLATKNISKLSAPITMIAGGCNKNQEEVIKKYQDMTVKAFEHYQGTIISGGTAKGVNKIAGEIKKKYPQNVTTCGYVSSSSCVTNVKKNVDQLRVTEGNDFSPLEPLQAWIDLITDDKNPQQVKVIGLNGGKIASVEYRVALAFGAKVAVIKGSGRKADQILKDPDWSTNKNLLGIPPDMMTLKVFIMPEIPVCKNKKKRLEIAQNIHDD